MAGASYSGDDKNPPPGTTACADAAGAVTVSPRMATPSLAIRASGPVVEGGQIVATATIAGGNSPAGRITFTVFGPADTGCATPLATSVVPVAGNGDYGATSFTPPSAGTYRWTAAYSGDADNAAPSPTACSDPAAAVAVTATSLGANDGSGLSVTVVAPGGSSTASSTSNSSSSGGGDGSGPGLAFTPVLSRILTGKRLFVRLKVPAKGDAKISYQAIRGTRIVSAKTTSTISIKDNNQTSVTFHLPPKARRAKVFRVSAHYQGITVARMLVRK